MLGPDYTPAGLILQLLEQICFRDAQGTCAVRVTMVYDLSAPHNVRLSELAATYALYVGRKTLAWSFSSRVFAAQGTPRPVCLTHTAFCSLSAHDWVVVFAGIARLIVIGSHLELIDTNLCILKFFLEHRNRIELQQCLYELQTTRVARQRAGYCEYPAVRSLYIEF